MKKVIILTVGVYTFLKWVSNLRRAVAQTGKESRHDNVLKVKSI